MNHLFIRRLSSKDSLTTTNDQQKALANQKQSTELIRPKRAFTLINPKTMHEIKRIDDVPIKNELDYIRHRLTEKRRRNKTQHCFDVNESFDFVFRRKKHSN